MSLSLQVGSASPVLIWYSMNFSSVLSNLLTGPTFIEMDVVDLDWKFAWSESKQGWIYFARFVQRSMTFLTANSAVLSTRDCQSGVRNSQSDSQQLVICLNSSSVGIFCCIASILVMYSSENIYLSMIFFSTGRNILLQYYSHLSCTCLRYNSSMKLMKNTLVKSSYDILSFAMILSFFSLQPPQYMSKRIKEASIYSWRLCRNARPHET